MAYIYVFSPACIWQISFNQIRQMDWDIDLVPTGLIGIRSQSEQDILLTLSYHLPFYLFIHFIIEFIVVSGILFNMTLQRKEYIYYRNWLHLNGAHLCSFLLILISSFDVFSNIYFFAFLLNLSSSFPSWFAYSFHFLCFYLPIISWWLPVT